MAEDRGTVLVVDDEADLADLYAAWLDDEYDVRVAYSGHAALDRMDDAVDVALVDRLMPETSGDEVLERIREEGYACRVAMVTAVEPDFDIIEMGFDDYLVKPIRRETLTETVESLLARTTYDRQLREYFALVSKRAALESQKSRRELEDSEAYGELTAAIDRMREELDRTAADMDVEDFEVALRRIDDG